MHVRDHEKLAEEFDRLANAVGSKSAPEQQQAIDRWFRAVPGNMQVFAFRLVSIFKARSHVQINTGCLVDKRKETTVDNSVSVNTGGGDFVGGAAGRGAKVDAQTIQNFKGNVNSSASIDNTGQQLFKDCIDEIANQDWTAEEKEALLKDLDALRAQAAKDKPSDPMMTKLWGGIVSVAKALPTIAALGRWLGAKFPVLANIPIPGL